MPRILARGVVFDHGAGRPFPTPFDLDLDPGWTGLVGPNGAGKTTLLRLFAGELDPDAGELRVDGGRPWLLRQLVEARDDEATALERFADDWSSEAGQLRSRLRLDEAPLARWSTLSPGERKRWQLGAALARRPQLLLCDEPSNHLDAQSRALLLDALARHRGVGIVVSHDRELLDALCSTIVFIDAAGRVEQRPGNYSCASAARELEREARRSEYARVQASVRGSARQLADARRRRAATTRSTRSSSRKRDHRDHDASSSARKGRAERAAAQAEGGVRRAHAAHARAEARLAALEVEHEHRGSLFVDWIAPRKSTLLTLDATTLPARAPHSKTRLPREGSVAIARDDRIHLRGPSGAGKSSLLRAIYAQARASGLGERTLWLPQELDADARRELLTRMAGLDREARGRMLQLVANVGLDPDQLFATDDPSPGEARKLALALGLSQRSCCLLLLDEPTNHFDLPTIEALERMLVDYPGALVLVCHDQAFARATTERSWSL